jgi:hypothetical protein
MLSISDFKKVKLEDKELFDRHYDKFPQVHSDYLFSTIISWMDYADYHYTLLKDCLIIFTRIENQLRFRPPVGKRIKDVFKEVIQLAKKEDAKYPFGLIDSQTKEWLSEFFPKLECTPHRGYFEYVYNSSDLAILPGSRYAKIRNRLNKFNRNYSYDVESITEENIHDVKKFLNRWCLWKDCESDPILEHEKKAVIYSMDHFSELELSGIIIRINGDVEAMAVFEQMSSDTAVVHYEKASPYYAEIYKAINSETAKILQKEFRFINRESDLDIPGLRKAKMSYHPHHMVEVFHIDRDSLLK